MVLIHSFILANRKQDLESGGSYSVYDLNESVIQDGGDGMLPVLFE